MTAVNRSLTKGLTLAALLLAASSLGCEEGFQVVEQPAPTEGNSPTPSPTAWLNGHLVLSPESLDFGPTALRCRAVKEITLYNDGQQPVRVFGVATSLTSTPEFGVDDYTTSIDPFANLTIPVGYRPTDVGADNATLLVQTDDIHQEVHAAPLTGRDSPVGEQLDTFFQPPGVPADFIWVLDTSGSMTDDTDKVIANFGRFMEQLNELDVDYQMALVTTSLDDNGEFKGSFGPDELPWITSDMGAEGVSRFLDVMYTQSRELRQTDERGLDSITKSLSDEYLETIHKGFIRDGARLVITAFSDENDHSTVTPASAAQRFRAVKKTDEIVFSAVVGIGDGTSACHDEEGARYIQLAYEFGGYVENICLPTYSTLMSTLGSYGAASDAVFPLKTPPELVYGFTVTVEGEEVPAADPPDDTSPGWRYDADQNAIVFNPGSVPPSGSRIDVRYITESDCQ